MTSVTLVDVLKARIRFLLAARGLSSQQLSIDLKRTKNWLHGFLDGETQKELSLEDIEKVALALQVTPMDLLDARALQPLAGLDTDDLLVAHAFHHQTNREKKDAVRDILGLGDRAGPPRRGQRLQRGRTGTSDRDHAAEFRAGFAATRATHRAR